MGTSSKRLGNDELVTITVIDWGAILTAGRDRVNPQPGCLRFSNCVSSSLRERRFREAVGGDSKCCRGSDTLVLSDKLFDPGKV